MCGIAGFVNDMPIDVKCPTLQRMTDIIAHRGPDSEGHYIDEHVALGHRRLSIIDLGGGQQPIYNEDGSLVITFNGEIYNYVELRKELQDLGYTFNTSGDGEPILVGYHHWGKDVVKHLRGMFGIAIWDTKEKQLFLARDPFGIKPLYYATTDKGTVFASEKKCILEMAPELGLDLSVDYRAVEHYVDLQYVPEPESLHTHIRRLESGCIGTVTQEGVVKQERYFKPQFNVRGVVKGEEQVLFDRIARALEDSVEKHMRADVTVGSFLSGGIDSTAIAALAKRYNPDLLTFTAAFRAEGYSENDVADESARAIGVEHVTRWVTEEELTRTLPLIIWYLDDPVADPALVPLYFVANEARKHVKVVLSGEGADEFFGGYTIYHEPVSLAGFEHLPMALRRGLGAVSRALPNGIRGKDMLRRGALRLEDRYYGNARIFREEQLPGLLRPYDPSISFHDVTDPLYETSRPWDPVQRMQHVDLFSWLRGDILVKADRMTMANSLELRVPFLDKEVFEVARRIPMSEKLAGGTTKYAMRKALERIVPEHVLHRRKLGFPVPTRVYLKGDSYAWARDIIESSPTDEFIDPKAAMRLLDEHRAGVADHSRRVWTIVCFMLWYDIFVAGTVTPEVPRPEYPVRL